MSSASAAKRLKLIGEGKHPYLGKKWEVFGPLRRGGPLGLGKSVCTRIGHTEAKPPSPVSKAIPYWSDSPGWAVDEHVEACLGRGLVSSEAVHEVNPLVEEVAELARMDAEFEAFRACTDASGQEVNEPADPFEEDPFGHGVGLL